MSKSRYVITITRQFGSMGRQIARKLAENLGIEYYDRDIVDHAAAELKLPVSTINEEEERAATKIRSRYISMMFPYGMPGPLGAARPQESETRDQIFEAQKNIIRFLAEKDTCVIVGRCADFVLSDLPDVINIYIYASYEDRLKNCCNELGMEEDEAKQMIREVDAARTEYHLHYAGFRPDDQHFKDICIDSSFLGVDGTAAWLAEAVRRKYPDAPVADRKDS